MPIFHTRPSAVKAARMGYDQWVAIQIDNSTDRTLTLQSFDLRRGKLYAYPNKDEELNLDSVEYKAIVPHSSLSFANCRLENSTRGCEGDILVFNSAE